MGDQRMLAIVFLISVFGVFCQGEEINSNKALGRDFKGSTGNSFNSPPNKKDPWGFYDAAFEKPTFQDWSEWMAKRNRNPSWSQYGGGLDAPDFQSWKEWMVKRGVNNGGIEAFTGLDDMDKAQFQKWSDWFSKRGPNQYKLGKGYKGNNFQRWTNLAKRGSNFDEGLQGIDDSHQMQTWHEWMKRQLGGGSNNPFDASFGAKPYLMKWEDMYKRQGTKRQLNAAPSFGTNRQYFTDGLQDWRSTFKASKRVKDGSKTKSD